MHGRIQSIGPPPERHADRVVAEMMRELACKHATLWDEIGLVIYTSSNGTPKAQRKLAERIKHAGAVHTRLWPGKRGRFEIMVYDFTGWDASRNAEIKPGDHIPEKPWICCNVSFVTSKGGGANRIDADSRPILFITHHAMSRVAQRLGMRTSKHMMTAARVIWNGCIDMINGKEKGDAWLNPPPAGWRVPLKLYDGTVAYAILKRHEKRQALIAATVID